MCAEFLALELLDFIHVWIEDSSSSDRDEGLQEKCLRDYLQAHLDDRDDESDGELVRFVDKKFKIGHAIALFDFVVKKLRERS